MKYSLFFFLIIGIFFYMFHDSENPLFRFASQLVKVDEATLQQVEEKSAERLAPSATCSLDNNFDFSCAPVTTAGAVQQFPIYFWGAPGAPHPRTDSPENCAAACRKKGNGFCIWRQNGPEFSGGTACYFVSAELCNHSSMVSEPATKYLPSQVVTIKSGRCE